jgi:hypothetical protein
MNHNDLMVEVEDLNVSFGKKHIVYDVSYEISNQFPNLLTFRWRYNNLERREY